MIRRYGLRFYYAFIPWYGVTDYGHHAMLFIYVTLPMPMCLSHAYHSYICVLQALNEYCSMLNGQHQAQQGQKAQQEQQQGQQGQPAEA